MSSYLPTPSAGTAGSPTSPTSVTSSTPHPRPFRATSRPASICAASAPPSTTRASSAAVPNAIAGAIEFDQGKAQETVFIPSRLFIYYNERSIEGTVATDSGAQIRDGIKSVASLGAPPETDCPYVIADFAQKPSDAAFADAKQHLVVLYQRLIQEVNTLKGCLASGFPFVFGFTCYESFESQAVAASGILPMPASKETVIGGHAVVCVGYDDADQHFLVRNSYGPNWGLSGYFKMPYAYLTSPRLASDLWTIRSVQ